MLEKELDVMTPADDDSDRLRTLFRIYSAALGQAEPAHSGQFRCPLCLKYFAPTQDVPLKEILAEEHIVPSALGGRLTTLTCRRCNNTSGSRLESHLIHRVRVETRKAPLRARVEYASGTHGAEVLIPTDSASGEPITITGVKAWSDQREVDKILAAIRTQRVESFTLHLNAGYVHHRTQLALVRAAYLLMFRTFGYSYVNDVSSAVPREQLDAAQSQFPVLKGIMWSVPTPPAKQTCITVLAEPASIRSFFVLLRLSDEPLHVTGVILPPPGTENANGLFESLDRPEAEGDKSGFCMPPVDGFANLQRLWAMIDAELF